MQESVSAIVGACVIDSDYERSGSQTLNGNRYGLIISEKQSNILTQIDIEFVNSEGNAEFVVKHK